MTIYRTAARTFVPFTADDAARAVSVHDFLPALPEHVTTMPLPALTATEVRLRPCACPGVYRSVPHRPELYRGERRQPPNHRRTAAITLALLAAFVVLVGVFG